MFIFMFHFISDTESVITPINVRPAVRHSDINTNTGTLIQHISGFYNLKTLFI